jgi:hypothetical protein
MWGRVWGVDEGRRAAWATEVETHRRIRGRLWRVSDPRIPDDLRQRLVDELMAARRAMRAAGGADGPTRDARDRVQDAKVALGERGLRWWLDDADQTGEETDDAAAGLADRIRRTRRALGGHGVAGDDEVAAVTSTTAAVVRGVDPGPPDGTTGLAHP